MDELGFEDREILLQVMGQAVEKMTHTQSLCAFALIAGWSQEEVGKILRMDQSSVSRNFASALGIIRTISIALMHN